MSASASARDAETTSRDEAAAIAAARAFDLRHLDPGFLENPYPTYDALRRYEPVHRMADGSYILTRYEDVVAIYRDHARMSSDKRVEFKPKYGDSPLYEHHTTSLVFRDAPFHTRVRGRIAGALTPRALGALEPRVVAVVDRLLERAAKAGGMDLIADYASALPIEVIGDLLGVPRDERGPLRGWSLAILGALEPVLSEAQFDQGCRAVAEFKSYLRDLVAHRRTHPSGEDGEILGNLIAPGADGQELTETELLHQCIFLLNAGHETTTNLIGNGVESLFRFPDEKARLDESPDLIRLAVEEFLRFESSNQLGNRRALTDVTIAGVAMPAGTQVTLCIGAANHDPSAFPNPERLDITRSPNRHLAFGAGIHACAGMSLARMEGRIAIGRLLARFPDIHESAPFIRGGRARFRGFLSLPVNF